jgi:hypothetical protein
MQLRITGKGIEFGFVRILDEDATRVHVYRGARPTKELVRWCVDKGLRIVRSAEERRTGRLLNELGGEQTFGPFQQGDEVVLFHEFHINGPEDDVVLTRLKFF